MDVSNTSTYKIGFGGLVGFRSSQLDLRVDFECQGCHEINTLIMPNYALNWSLLIVMQGCPLVGPHPLSNSMSLLRSKTFGWLVSGISIKAVCLDFNLRALRSFPNSVWVSDTEMVQGFKRFGIVDLDLSSNMNVLINIFIEVSVGVNSSKIEGVLFFIMAVLLSRRAFAEFLTCVLLEIVVLSKSG